MIQYEIERRKIYIHNITEIIKCITKNCPICVDHKLNKYIKPSNKQIISKKPLERLQIDITYFSKKLELEYIENKYLINFTEHFSKFAKGYIIDNKSSKIVIEKLKDFIKNYGKPEIIHTDNGGEFISNEFKLFCLENGIKIIHGSFHHPQSQGAVERYNRNIIDKLIFFSFIKI